MSKVKQAVWGMMIASMGLAAIPAFADGAYATPSHPMGPGKMMHCRPGPWRHGPMCGAWMKRMLPVPMLMPIVRHRAIELRLTPAQESNLENWRNTHRKDFHAWRHDMMLHNQALRDALLRGESGSALAPQKAAVVKDHERMLDRGIQQVHYLHKLLTPVQWGKVVRIYQHMSKHR